MAKRNLLFVVLVTMSLLTSVSLYAEPEDIPLERGYTDPSNGQHNPHKYPSLIPEVSIDNHELIFQSSHSSYSIDIILNGIVVYSVDVDECTSSIVLPSWLSGEYELQLFPEGSDYYFYGFITL